MYHILYLKLDVKALVHTHTISLPIAQYSRLIDDSTYILFQNLNLVNHMNNLLMISQLISQDNRLMSVYRD